MKELQITLAPVKETRLVEYDEDQDLYAWIAENLAVGESAMISDYPLNQRGYSNVACIMNKFKPKKFSTIVRGGAVRVERLV